MVQGGAWVLERVPSAPCVYRRWGMRPRTLPAPRPWSSALRIFVFICLRGLHVSVVVAGFTSVNAQFGALLIVRQMLPGLLNNFALYRTKRLGS